jgi:hypothetical protein
MFRFKQYLTEATDEDKLTHLEHVEDHAVHGGSKGFAHAFHTLNGVHDTLMGKQGGTKVTMKYDGSPSVVFGHHPETGKFFVGTKGTFNKTPKIAHTPEDIEKHYGHSEGLKQKMHAALEHLPKIMPDKGIYQADIMHTPNDLKHEGHRISHKTQLITYHHKPNSEEARKAMNSQIGVAVHTAYDGKTMQDMKVRQAHVPEMKDHEHVHQFPMFHQMEHVSFTQDQQKQYKQHMANAMEGYKKAPKEAFEHIQAHETKHGNGGAAVSAYLNKTVRDGSTPSHEGMADHLKAHYAKKAAGVKTEVAQQRHLDAGKKHVASINKEHLTHVLGVHGHLQKAKNVLTDAFNSHHIHGHEFDGQPTNPEGYVVHHNGRPSKFVLRHEFSKMNFAASEMRKKGGK